MAGYAEMPAKIEAAMNTADAVALRTISDECREHLFNRMLRVPGYKRHGQSQEQFYDEMAWAECAVAAATAADILGAGRQISERDRASFLRDVASGVDAGLRWGVK
jgi:hypothetical protein